MDETREEFCWLKLNNQTGISTTDTYLCAIYIPPAESPYHDEEYLNNIHTEISRFQAQGNVLLCGDFNARTGSEPDNIDPKGNEHAFGQNPLSLTKNCAALPSLGPVHTQWQDQRGLFREVHVLFRSWS